MMDDHQALTADQDLILIVDDNKDLCCGVKRLLDMGGLSAQYLTSPKKAWELLQKVNPKILLLDVMMPEMSGVELLRLIRLNPQTANLPIVMMTATNDDDDLAEVRRLGVKDIIIKGKLDWSQFVSRVKSYIASI